jgi:hypothetical protein
VNNLMYQQGAVKKRIELMKLAEYYCDFEIVDFQKYNDNQIRLICRRLRRAEKRAYEEACKWRNRASYFCYSAVGVPSSIMGKRST